MSENTIRIGKTFRQDKAFLHVLALKDSVALLESQFGGKVTRYIVASSVYIEKDGELHWNGGGRYFLCGDDAADALRRASICFSGGNYVYVLTMDTEEQDRPSVYRTYDLALAALQRELDKNQSMQEVAAEILAIPLTAEFYIDHAAYFNERMMDVYTIDEMIVVEK